VAENRTPGMVLKLLLVGAMAIIFLKWIGVNETIKLLGKANIYLFIAAVLASMSIQIVRAARFYLAARSARRHIGFGYTVAVQFVSSITGLVTPFRIGEGSKLLFYPKGRRTLAYFFVAEKIADVLSLIILGAISMLFFGRYIGNYGIVVIAAVTAITGIGIFAIMRIEKLIRLVFKKNLRTDWFMQHTRIFVRKREFIYFNLLSLAIWFIMALSQDLFLRSVGIKISFATIILVMAVSLIIGLSTGIPGGIGPRELTFTFLLHAVSGVDKTGAGLAAILTTLGGLIGTTAAALPSYLMIRKSYRFTSRSSRSR
jgi:uncharacterized protein (TIRG00374 family)